MVCNVYAADDIYLGTTHLLTPEETLLVFGDSLDGVYWNGQAFENCSFEYVTTLDYSKTYDTSGFYDSSGYFGNHDFSYLIYRCPIIPSNDGGGGFTIKLAPQYFDFSSVNFFSCSVGLSVGPSKSLGLVSTFATWDVSIDSVSNTFRALSFQYDYPLSGALGITTPINIDVNQNIYYTPIVFSNSSSDSFSLSSGNTTFYWAYSVTNIEGGGGGVYFYVTTPRVSEDIQWDHIDSGGDDDDGILQGIKNLIESIIETLQSMGSNIANFIIQGLQNIFIPDQEDLEDFRDDLDGLLSDTFGTAYESNQLIHTAIADIQGVSSADSSIYFPGVYFREYTIIAPQNVPIKPEGFDTLFNMLARVIDIIATFGVINAFKHRFERGIMENDG